MALKASSSRTAKTQGRNLMKTLVLTALATILVSPALAQSVDPSVGSGNIASYRVASAGSVANNPQAAFASVLPAAASAGATREQALRQCSAGAGRYGESTWGTMQAHQFRTCMVANGQPE
jgi:hypothetical protein